MATKPATGGRARVIRLDDIARPRALAGGLARVARAGGGPGGDGVTVADFLADAGRELSRLGDDLRRRRYRPHPARRYPLVKANGGKRWLAVPSVRDRVVQATLAMALDRAFDETMSPASFAYRRGLSVEHAAARAMLYVLRGHVWALDGDIRRFFDSVPHKALLGELARLGVCAETCRLVGLWLNAHNRRGRGLPQGAPVSPVLANLYLAPFDRAMDTRRRRLVRYADDFLVLARNRTQAEAARKQAKLTLARLGLKLHAGKTRIAHLKRGVRFLGLKISTAGVARAG